MILTLLLIITPLYVHGPPGTEAQRYSPTTTCIGDSESASLDCVSCDTRITISPTRGKDCRPIVGQGRSLDNEICTELEDAIESIAMKHTVHDMPFGCVEVLIEPKGQTDSYIVHANPGRIIAQSVVFKEVAGTQRKKRQMGPSTPTPTQASVPQSSELVTVSFMDNEEQVPGDTDNVQYVLQFKDSSLVGMSGILFQDASGRIGIEDVDVVAIEYCNFEYFSQGAVDVYNCPTVFVTETTFRHNGPVITKMLMEYRGDSAGLSVALNKQPSDNNPPLLLRITNCTFRNNSSGVEPTDVATNITDSSDDLTVSPTSDDLGTGEPPTGMGNEPNNNDGGGSNGGPPERRDKMQAIGGVVEGLQFLSRGGGLALIVNDDDPADIVIQDCEFRANGALAFGGGMYIGLDGKSQHFVIINQSKFVNNSSPSTGGGLQISFLKEGETGFFNQVLLLDTEFTNNEATYGGGVFFLPIDIDPNTVTGASQIGVFVQFERCAFVGNNAMEAGGAFGGAFRILAYNTKPLVFEDCLFENNTVEGAGVVSTAFYPLTFQGNNTFLNNRGVSLAVIGSRVIVHGNLVFQNNNDDGGSLDGGALYVTSQGQVELTAGAQISFIDNTGITGAALYVQTPHVPLLFSKLSYNPLCVFLFEDGQLSPELWHNFNLSLQFTGNEAVVSSAVYINNLNLCSWTSLSPPYFNQENVFHWNFVNYTDNVNRAHVNSTDPRWAVQTPPVDVDIAIDQIAAFPGQRINFDMNGYDELGEPTTVVSRIFDNSEGQDDLFKFTPATVSLDKVNSTTSLNYALTSRMQDNDVRDIHAVSLLKPHRRITAEGSFNIRPRPCPAGLTLKTMPGDSEISVCVCDEERKDIITCRNRFVTLNTHLWGARAFQQNPDANVDPLSTYPCPPGYCSCNIQMNSGLYECDFVFDPFLPNDQCNCYRQGVLCGDCTDDRGFSALFNQCVTCNSPFALLILVLIVVDLGIIMLLLILMKPIPLWVYPVLYYIQILPHFTEHFPVTFELVRPYVYYVASATGLYFPYDFCLHSGLDAPGVYALRYLPLTVAVVVTIVVLLIRSKKCRPCPWHGVWWVILLLYTPVLHTSMSVLNCPIIPAGNETASRWYINGNINCFSGTHIPLGLFSISVLACCIALIPIVILVSLGKTSFPGWLRFLEEPITVAYKSKYKWWSGIELAKRVILVLFAVAFPNNDYAVIMTLMALICISGYCKPYKKKIINILDLILAGDILVLLLLRNEDYLKDSYQVLTSEQVISSGMIQLTCGTSFKGITHFVSILTPFYYIPLVISLGILVFFLFYKTYRLCRYIETRIVDKENPRRVLSIRSDTEEVRPRTQTIVDMNELDSEPSTPNSLHSKNFNEDDKDNARFSLNGSVFSDTKQHTSSKLLSSLNGNEGNDTVPTDGSNTRNEDLTETTVTMETVI